MLRKIVNFNSTTMYAKTPMLNSRKRIQESMIEDLTLNNQNELNIESQEMFIADNDLSPNYTYIPTKT